MLDVTFALAILLATGILLAKVVQMFSLPSVTGFILAGLIIGPSGFSLITSETVGQNLDHFTQIALMLIAFGIGEHLELRRLGAVARQVAIICSTQAIFTFLLTASATFLVSRLISPDHSFAFLFTLSLLLGSVAIANAPASILHIVRELDAKGPLTSTLMAVIAFGDGLAIAVFGITVSIAHQLTGPQDTSILVGFLNSLWEIGGSLLIGILTGLLIDVVLHKTHHRNEMLTAGLALLLLCGELTRIINLSPLLAGMAAGFILINREERDSRLFRILNGFEPPVHVLFFTLAGVHVDLSMVAIAGWLGLTYFIARLIGKYYGSWFGSYLCDAPLVIRNNIGLGLFPQAGIAIGLAFVINTDQSLFLYAEILTPIILAGVILAELIGPIPAKKAFINSNEARFTTTDKGKLSKIPLTHYLFGRSEELQLEPWSKNTLHPVPTPEGVVIFGATNYATVRSLARIATILAHYHNATPLSVRFNNTRAEQHHSSSKEASFLPEIDEVKSLGYPLLTRSTTATIAAGLIDAAHEHNCRALVFGYPLGRNPLAVQNTVHKVAENVSCPVVAVRLIGNFSYDKILVPFIKIEDLEIMRTVLDALTTAVATQFTFLQLLPSESSPKDIKNARHAIRKWAVANVPEVSPSILPMPTEARLEAILEEARRHDLVIVKATIKKGLKRIFLGSLSLAVTVNCTKPVLSVYPGRQTP